MGEPIITKPIRLIELFAGIGSQAMALRDIGADFESWRCVEFDKFAIASYNAIHGTDYKITDIRDISAQDLGISETDKFTYLLTYSFPCQDLSVSGLMKGMKDTSTRSGLVWEVGRLLSECDEKPQVLLMENVPNVHSKKFIDDFNRWLEFLESLGYKSVWADLSATDFGVAQSRTRCFCVSWLGDGSFEFPVGEGLCGKTIDDYLDESVDEGYYENTDRAKNLIEKLIADGKLANTERERETN